MSILKYFKPKPKPITTYLDETKFIHSQNGSRYDYVTNPVIISPIDTRPAMNMAVTQETIPQPPRIPPAYIGNYKSPYPNSHHVITEQMNINMITGHLTNLVKYIRVYPDEYFLKYTKELNFNKENLNPYHYMRLSIVYSSDGVNNSYAKEIANVSKNLIDGTFYSKFGSGNSYEDTIYVNVNPENEEAYKVSLNEILSQVEVMAKRSIGELTDDEFYYF